MTKAGYTHIIVPKQLHERLKNLAQQNNLSIAQLITQLININVNVNVSINTSINTTQLNQQHLSLLQPLNQQKSPNQVAFTEKNNKKSSDLKAVASKLIRPSQPSRFIDTIGEPGSPRANSANAKAGNPVGSRQNNTRWLKPGVFNT
jgi:hypothetical protein